MSDKHPIPPDMTISSKRPTIEYMGVDGTSKKAGGTPLDPRRVVGLGKDLDAVAAENRKRPGEVDRLIGLGMDLKQGVGAAEMVQPIIDGLNADISKIPVIHQSRWNFNGPLTDAAVQLLYGAQCDIFGAGKAPAGVQAVQSTMPINGELQTYAVLCGIFYHMEPEPLSFVVPGNAWSVGGTAMPAASAISVISPDAYSQIDVKAATGAATTLAAVAANVLGLAAADTLVPALLNWGRWSNYAAWHMARAYNFLWQWGMHTTLANIPLRHIAYVPTSVERGSVGQIDVEVHPYSRRVNATNRGLVGQAGTASFLPRNARRTGNMNINAVANTSLFTPDTSFDRSSAIYGGMGIRDLLRSNSEYFRLPAPYGVRPGVALGMLLNASDNVELGFMQNELSVTQGLGLGSSPVTTVPPVIFPDNNITGNAGWTALTGTTNGMVEVSRDTIATQAFLQTLVQRALFKGGSYFQTVGMLGYELTEKQWRQVQDMAGAQEVLDLACGCQFVA